MHLSERYRLRRTSLAANDKAPPGNHADGCIFFREGRQAGGLPRRRASQSRRHQFKVKAEMAMKMLVARAKGGGAASQITELGKRAGPRFRDIAARGNQEAGFTQPRAHSFAQPCTVQHKLKQSNVHECTQRGSTRCG